MGPIIFHDITVRHSLLNTYNDIIVYDYIEFSNIETNNLIVGELFNIKIMEHTNMNITNNNLQSYTFLVQDDYNIPFSIYSPCLFQFYKRCTKEKGHQNSFVTITSNLVKNIFNNVAGNINCRWYPNSLYYGQIHLQYTKTIFNYMSIKAHSHYLSQDCSAIVQTNCNLIVSEIP